MAILPSRPAPAEITAEEWDVRVELAALYRLFVRYGWTDLIYTHISARVPGEPEHYLINPYGLLFDEVTASNLIKVNFEGEVVAGDYPYNDAGHAIHSAVLKARPEMNFALHSHTRAGMAVAAMKCGLLPLTQHAMTVMEQVAYHEWDLVGESEEECDRMAADLSDKYCLILHNHGLLTCGRTAAEAFYYLYFLECACKVQVDAMTSGAELVTPSDNAIQRMMDWARPGPEPKGDSFWPAMLRQLDRIDPSYKT